MQEQGYLKESEVLLAQRIRKIGFADWNTCYKDIYRNRLRMGLLMEGYDIVFDRTRAYSEMPVIKISAVSKEQLKQIRRDIWEYEEFLRISEGELACANDQPAIYGPPLPPRPPGLWTRLKALVGSASDEDKIILGTYSRLDEQEESCSFCETEDPAEKALLSDSSFSFDCVVEEASQKPKRL